MSEKKIVTESTSLALMSEASRMLAEASTIQQAKELKDLALTAADWARRKGLGEEAIQYARSYALRAERKMGEMLQATERAKGVRVAGGTTGGPVVLPPADDAPTLADLGVTKRESSEAQFLASMPEEEFEEVATGQKTLTTARRESKGPHVSYGTGNNEWYTPDKFIKAARTVMGSIDLDPASSEKANEMIKALRFYTIDEDGLTQKWAGNVWLNPPYSSDLIDCFADKMCAEYADGAVSQACVLVNNATETQWFQGLLAVSIAVCFLHGRVKYLDTEGKPRGTPLQGQAILYLGTQYDEFAKIFSEFGQVLVHVG